jgi:hypothetical protein
MAGLIIVTEGRTEIFPKDSPESYNWSNFKKMLEYFKIEAPKVSKRFIIVDWY